MTLTASQPPNARISDRPRQKAKPLPFRADALPSRVLKGKDVTDEYDAQDLHRQIAEVKALYMRERDLRRRLQDMLVRSSNAIVDDNLSSFMPIKTDAVAGAKGTVVVFGSLVSGDSLETLDFGRATSNMNMHRIHVVDFHQSWFQKGLIGLSDDVASTVEVLQEVLDAFPRPYSFVGSSSGGYGALLFGQLLNADKIITFSAQTKLTPHIKHSYGNIRMDGLPLDVSGPYADLHRVLKKSPLSGRAFMHYGNRNPLDKRQNIRMQNLDNVEVIAHPIAQHNCARRLSQMGQLDALLAGENV